jgi:pimeloyl-ACP methyl ester carboxylesterase
MEQGQDDEVGTEEVIEGCRVQHGELWNGDVKIHYVECGDRNGELVIDQPNLAFLSGCHSTGRSKDACVSVLLESLTGLGFVNFCCLQVVLVHGFPNFWYVWKNQFQELAEAGYHVVAPDMRGYNSSSKPKGIRNYSRRLVVSDIVRIMEQLGNGKPATVVSIPFTRLAQSFNQSGVSAVSHFLKWQVGHDWGGFVAWAVAEDFPDKVKKAVTVNVPHTSVFAEAMRSNFHQLRLSWYIGKFQGLRPPCCLKFPLM